MCARLRSSQRGDSSSSWSVSFSVRDGGLHGSLSTAGSCAVATHSIVSRSRRSRSTEIPGVERPIVGEPGVLVEVDGFDNERVAVPAADRVSEIAAAGPSGAAARRSE